MNLTFPMVNTNACFSAYQSLQSSELSVINFLKDVTVLMKLHCLKNWNSSLPVQ
jgi:hypothetical protein